MPTRENILMSYHTVLTNLYFLFIHADGKVSDTEIAMGENMVKAEGISNEEFKMQLILLKSKDISTLREESITGLKNLSREQQINCIAWLCVVANADGFMDRSEWQFIYNIYHTELRISLDQIMAKQKELMAQLYKVHSFSTIPIL
jgi:uncharacterized tellurite resistance protein B-like protein